MMASGICLVDGCEETRATRGLCGRHYPRFKNYGEYADLVLPSRRGPPDIARDQGYDQCCDRCRVELHAYAVDGGRGDRALLAGMFDMRAAAAYMLGFFDGQRRRTRDSEPIDPYIVQRFHELRR